MPHSRTTKGLAKRIAPLPCSKELLPIGVHREPTAMHGRPKVVSEYLLEKMRCLKSGGVLLERLPNASLWDFWKMQGVLYESIEIKAKQCNPYTVKAKLRHLGMAGRSEVSFKVQRFKVSHRVIPSSPLLRSFFGVLRRRSGRAERLLR